MVCLWLGQYAVLKHIYVIQIHENLCYFRPIEISSGQFARFADGAAVAKVTKFSGYTFV